jgi:murein DD-endopeptidase MepM/ murein hydrolase activator NlpD
MLAGRPDLPADDPPAPSAPVAGGEAVPAPVGAGADPAAFEPAPALQSSVQVAERKLSGARDAHQQIVERLATARSRHAELSGQLQALDSDGEAVTRALAEAESRLQDRAVAAFVSDEGATSAVVSSLEAAHNDSVLDLTARRVLVEAALDQDELAIGGYLEARARIDREALATLDSIRALERAMAGLAAEVARASAALDQAADELEAYRAGSAIYVHGVVFPVAEPYQRPLIDSWGFPRMVGTPDEHRHEGIDIFAPAGTPLLSAESGVVTRVGSGRLGGLTVWLRGDSGTSWYYAHLQSHQAGLEPGAEVQAGDVIGYVGNTGNAVSTPPHLHLEIHPSGGGPVNPYPLLKVIADRTPPG